MVGQAWQQVNRRNKRLVELAVGFEARHTWPRCGFDGREITGDQNPAVGLNRDAIDRPVYGRTEQGRVDTSSKGMVRVISIDARAKEGKRHEP